MKGNGTQSGTEKQGHGGASGSSEVKERRCLSRPYQPRQITTVCKITPSKADSPQAPLGQPSLNHLSHLHILDLSHSSCGVRVGGSCKADQGQNHLHNSTASLSRNPTPPNSETSQLPTWQSLPLLGVIPFGITNKVFPNKAFPIKATVAHHQLEPLHHHLQRLLSPPSSGQPA
jgi:hypothetical protein